MRIESLEDLDAAIARGPYAWPGGYAVVFYTADGGMLKHATVVAEYEFIYDAVKDTDDSGGWLVVGSEVYWEGPDEYDAHTGAAIVSEYGDPDAESDAV